MNTKMCSKCKKEKPTSEFPFKNKRLGKLQCNCKACQKIMKDAHYQNNRQHYIDKEAQRRQLTKEWIWNFKSTRGCEKCEETHPAALDFHHPGGKKEIWVHTAMKRGWARTRIMKEISKCQILCSNCHRKHHWEEWRTVSDSNRCYPV